ncbi:MAG: hypothetical protein HQK83_19020 [Fibrobacteria bacterium]|nr:hypothetical protein [Fibrobacteria bacterium]
MIWYDLCDPLWRAVRITTDGWEIVEKPPIIFKRLPHMQEQSVRNTHSDINQIFKFLNIEGDANKILFQVQLCSWFIESVPKPIYNFHGEKGSAKSTSCRILKRIIDPASVELLSLAKDEGAIIEQLAANYALVYDNVSSLNNLQSDLLCRAVTGGGNMKRKLYTDSEMIVYQFKRAIADVKLHINQKKLFQATNRA